MLTNHTVGCKRPYVDRTNENRLSQTMSSGNKHDEPRNTALTHQTEKSRLRAGTTTTPLKLLWHTLKDEFLSKLREPTGVDPCRCSRSGAIGARVKQACIVCKRMHACMQCAVRGARSSEQGGYARYVSKGASASRHLRPGPAVLRQGARHPAARPRHRMSRIRSDPYPCWVAIRCPPACHVLQRP